MVELKKQIETRLPQGDLSGIRLRDCNWSVKTAGPSPDGNRRTELFLLGCNKAMSGNPCVGCFNSTTWDSSKASWSHDPIKMAEHINNCAPNKYITIGGGEPTDQAQNLIILCKELKKYGFHIMMYTWRDLKETLGCNMLFPAVINPESIFRGRMNLLMKYVDVVVDGEFKLEEKMWDGTKEDGLISSVGSGNQVIWDIQHGEGYAMRDIEHLHINNNNELVYVLKNSDCECRSLKGGK